MSLPIPFSYVSNIEYDFGGLMKSALWIVLCLFFLPYIYGDSTIPEKAPVGWHSTNLEDGISSGIDLNVSHSGKGSGFLKSTNSNGFGSYVQSFDASRYCGKVIKLSAYLKTKDVTGWSGMWMRIDGAQRMLVLDNMQDRPLIGTKDWAPYEISLDVPSEGVNISFGILIKGTGTIWIDDASIRETSDKSNSPSSMTIRGKVIGDRQPVEGAVVAAISEFDEQPEKISFSKSDGSFELKDLTTAKHWISVSAHNYQASSVGPIEFSREKNELRLDLKKDGVLLSGIVKSDKTPVPQMFVSAYRYSNEEGDVYFTQTDRDGNYSILLPSGFKYGVSIHSEMYQDEWQTIELKESQNLDIKLSSINQPSAPQYVVDWIQKKAIPLKTVQAGNGFEDMQPLRKIVGDARVVCLGEATHGTKEFFQLKHRMLEFLVSEMGFNVFGIEANYPEAYAVNRYVLNGEGDSAEALAGLYFWTWNTEEVLEMIRWMRQYNLTHEKKVKFYGFDMQFPDSAAKFVQNYIKKVGGQESAELQQSFELLTKIDPSPNISTEQKDAASSAVQKVVEMLEKNKPVDIAKSSTDDWEVARQHARIMEQFVKRSQDKEGGYSVRDASMAENIQWILNHEGSDAKIVAWAHNGHVSFEQNSNGRVPMGWHLKNTFGKDLVVFGFAFNQGSFQSMDSRQKRLISFTVDPMPEGSLDETLAKANLKIAALDLRSIDTPAKEWFDVEHLTRSIGAMYDASSSKSFYYKSTITKNYDALLFVEKTSAAIPVSGKNMRPMIFAPEPTNLNFESTSSQ
jgi:erythromycin esterase